MLAEIMDFVVGSVSTMVVFALYKTFINKKSNVNEPISYPFLYIPTRKGFKCPKCRSVYAAQPAICSCFDFPREHFHFQCGGKNWEKDKWCCGFQCIMRTDDD
jgi:hypothetical protein